VESYPTLRLYRGGKFDCKYDGERNEQAMRSWLVDKVKSAGAGGGSGGSAAFVEVGAGAGRGIGEECSHRGPGSKEKGCTKEDRDKYV
jgi:hypothetical protein